MNEDIDVQHLISLVSQNPVISDETYQGIRSRSLTKDAWINVASKLHPQFTALSDKEKNDYIKLLTSKWSNICHEQSSFLNKTTPLNETGSEAGIPEPPDSQRNAGQKDVEEPTRKKPKIDVFARFYATSADGIAAVGAGVISSRTSKHDRKDRKTERSIAETADPYVLFSHSLLPSIRSFTVDERLQLQSGVIRLVQSIRGSRPVLEFPVSDGNVCDAANMKDTQPGTSGRLSLEEGLALLPPRSNVPELD